MSWTFSAIAWQIPSINKSIISKRILKGYKGFSLPSSMRACAKLTFPDKSQTFTVWMHWLRWYFNHAGKQQPLRTLTKLKDRQRQNIIRAGRSWPATTSNFTFEVKWRAYMQSRHPLCIILQLSCIKYTIQSRNVIFVL